MKPDDNLLQRYHEANEHDTARPGPALRENVLAQAREAARTPAAPGTVKPPAANDAVWRWRALGGLALLGLATLVVLQFDRDTTAGRDMALGTVVAPAVTSPKGAGSGARSESAASVEQSVDRRARELPQEQAPSALSSRRAAAAAAPAAPDATLLAGAERGAVDTVREALAQGANVNATNAQGRSALMLAAQRGDAPLVRLLLDAGADATLTDRDGARADELAGQAGHSALVPMLRGNR